MPNHVHLVLRPPTATALRALTSSVHTRYAQRINRREQSSGHLFQDRYRSYPIDDAHLMVAVRCVASARAHLSLGTDPLTVVGAMAQHIPNWRAYLRDGFEAADRDAAIERALRDGRPLRIPPTRDSPSS